MASMDIFIEKQDEARVIEQGRTGLYWTRVVLDKCNKSFNLGVKIISFGFLNKDKTLTLWSKFIFVLHHYCAYRPFYNCLVSALAKSRAASRLVCTMAGDFYFFFF